MNERLTKIKTTPVNFGQVEVKAKIVMIGSVVVVIALAAIVTFFASKTTYVPLYKDLSTREIGQVKEALDSQGVTYQIAPWNIYFSARRTS